MAALLCQAWGGGGRGPAKLPGRVAAQGENVRSERGSEESILPSLSPAVLPAPVTDPTTLELLLVLPHS